MSQTQQSDPHQLVAARITQPWDSTGFGTSGLRQRFLITGSYRPSLRMRCLLIQAVLLDSANAQARSCPAC